MSRNDRTRDPVSDVSSPQSCPLCQLPDSDGMVCCDDCERWFHFGCVGVNEDVANHDWSCKECIDARIPASQPPLSRTPTGEPLRHPLRQSIPVPTDPRLPTPRPRISPVPSPRVHTPRTPIVPSHSSSPNPPPPTPRPRTPRMPIEQPGAPPTDRHVSFDANLVNRLPPELRIQLLAEEEAIERKFLWRRFQILLESTESVNPVVGNNISSIVPTQSDGRNALVSHSSPMSSHHRNIPQVVPCTGNQHRVGFERLNEQELYVPIDIPPSINTHNNFSAFNPNPTNRQQNTSTFARPRADQQSCNPSSFLPNPSQRPNASAFAPYVGLPRSTVHDFYPYDSHDFPSAMGGTALLNRSQIAARHAVAKELPVFCGEPEEWPLFFATYENTTYLCGFSPQENMARLQKCLRGKALEAVKCQLLHPTNLEQVLSTLRMLFGRPEIIVHSLLQKINALPAPKADRLGTLVDFSLAVRNMVATVKACDLEPHLCNLTLLHSLADRLPPMIRLNWATHRQSLPLVTLSDFSDWLYKLAEAANAVTLPQYFGSVDNKIRRGRKDDGFLNAHVETVPEAKQNEVNDGCIVCNGSCKSVEKCIRFASMDLATRWDVIRKYKLCRCCLRNHRGPCRLRKLCGKNGCEYKHHRLMHNDAKDKPTSQLPNPILQTHVPEQEIAGSSRGTNSCNTHRGENKAVLFQYVPVTLYHNGAKVLTHAFLDSGSSLTLMEECLAKELNLRGEKHPLCLRWTAETCRYEDDAMRVSLDISGTYSGSSRNHLTDVYTVKELKLPPQSLSIRQLSEKYSHLDGLPIESYNNVQPKLLIGMNNVRVVHALESREGKPNEPVAVKTRLGWTIYGRCSPGDGHASISTPYNYHICFHSCDSDEILHETVKKFFALDSLGIEASQNQFLSKEDERALAKLRDTTTFKNGRYQVALLWKYDDVRLPNNRSMALRRHLCLAKRMEREPELSTTMRSKMADYEQKGYIRKLTHEESRKTGDRTWYLPIFPVYNPNKPGKVRIVFDAAASFKGVSLNSVLMKGPDQINDLPPVLYKFRERLIGLGGDVAEMFHQMRMNSVDEDSQRIVWCASEDSSEPCDYVMQVVTFGATCSPSTALYVLNNNAARFVDEFPAAVDAIRHRHYVDDMLTSVDTKEEAVKLAKEVRYIHQQGGFHMRNWVSNSSAVLEALDEMSKIETSMEMNSDLAMEKVLGMWWNTATDVFQYKLCTERNRDLLTGAKHPTKRDVLRTLMAIYDPLGLIAHYLMFLKVLLQEVWRSNTEWDEQIGQKELKKWYTWLRILPELESVEIPRCYYRVETRIDEATIELHTFVDASELGYAAVAYFRFIKDGHVHCALVGSKTRVAPLKFVSIPRLELQAAVVGTRFARSIAVGHSINIDRRYFWTDARDVMCWLQSDHRRYSQFVAFRVGEILESTDVTEWRWLGTKVNVADDGTKWKNKPDLLPGSRWFNGPPFLWKSKAEWPKLSLNGVETHEEARLNLLHHSERCTRTILLPQNFSSWYRLQRATAYVQRFLNNIRLKKKGQQPNVGPLTGKELLDADTIQIRRAQDDVYAAELAILAAGKRLHKRNSLFKVNPFVDEKGVMRIHSRLSECDFLDESSRYPTVLPRDHPVTLLIVRDIHLRYHHQCHETCVNEVRSRFHIPRVRTVYNRVRRECQVCKLHRVLPAPPAMSYLPKARLAAFVRPFSYVGVDFFGPFSVVVGRRHEKRWGVIITCLTTRAIHLELAASLNTSSCILALNNCFARRGTPIEIISDRGTNFVGADRELKEAIAALDQDQFMTEFTTSRTSWRFNPPASPHMGGCWERLIQSVKKILAKIKPQRTPTDEVLRNYLIEVENIINSRPLTHVPLDDCSAPALTPNHFLLGSSDGSKPLVPYDDCPVTLQRSWKASQALANLFWKRWVTEYLPTITRRTKWFYPVRPIAVGQIVVIADPSFPRNCWPKGRVVSVKTATDGQVRSAVVQTTTGLYERPATKLAVLDVGANTSGSKSPPTGGECCAHPSSDTAPTSNNVDAAARHEGLSLST